MTYGIPRSQEFGQPKPIELLDGGEYVSGGDVWLSSERSVDKLLLCLDFATADTPFGTLDCDDSLTPTSTQTGPTADDLHGYQPLLVLLVLGCRLRCRRRCRQRAPFSGLARSPVRLRFGVAAFGPRDSHLAVGQLWIVQTGFV